MPAGMRAPASPIGRPDISYGLPGAGGLLTEWAESVPDLTWPESIRTYGRMRRDPKLTAVLSAFFLPILRANWAVDPAGVKNAKAVDLVSGDLGLPVLGQKGRVSEAAVRGFKWKEHVRLAMLRLVYGHMPFEQWYDPQGKDGLTHLAGLAERQPHTIAIIDVDDGGQIRAVEQNTQTQPIPANRLLWYVNEREGANWAGVSLLRSCYTPWILKHEVLRVHATSHRRWGMGVPVVHAPPGGTPGQIEEARRLATGMRAGDQAGAGLPDGFTFEIAGLTGSVPDAVAFLQFLNEEMTGSALAKVLELGSTASGSRALGDTFLDFFLLALQAAADAIGETATYGDPSMPGISRALTEFNFGDGEPCPRIIATDVGDRHEITATAIQQLVACGALQPDDELEGFLREAWSLPARKTPRAAPPAPAPPGRAAPPAPAQGGEQPSPGGAGQLPPGGQRPATEPPPPRQRPPSPAAAARPDGQARDLTDAEAAAGLDPQGMRHELELAADRVLAQWAPVLAGQRADLADQVTAAVDDGRLDQLAALAVPAGPAAGLLYRAMAAVAAKSAGRMIAEAAGQGVDIDPAAVRVDHTRLRQLATARAALAAGQLAQAASRRALQVVTASAGTDAAREVLTVLHRLSPRPLADQLMAALHTAANEARLAVLDAGPEGVYTATEINDANCLAPWTHVMTRRGTARADQVGLDDELLTHTGRWAAPSRIIVHEVTEPLVTIQTRAGNLTVTADHPVLARLSGAGPLTWREAGKLHPGDQLVHVEPHSQAARELRVPDLLLAQPPHRVAPGGQVRRLTRIDIRAQRMPVRAVRLDDQPGGGEVHDPRADLDFLAEGVPGGGQCLAGGPLNAGLGSGRPVAAAGTVPPAGCVGTPRPEWVTAASADKHDRRAAPLTEIAACPRAVGEPAGGGNGHGEYPVAAGAGLGHAAAGLRAGFSAHLRVSPLAGDRAVDGPVCCPPGGPCGQRAPAPPAGRRDPAGRPGSECVGAPRAAFAERPANHATPASPGALHGLIIQPIEALTWEDYTGSVYDFTIPGDATYLAGGVVVHNCCDPCREIDGHVFAGLDDARAHYANGAYVHCAGELRCRGTVVASWPHTPFRVRVPGAAEASAPDAEAAAEWREGLHRRDRRGRFARKTGPAPGSPAGPARPPGTQAGLPWTADGGIAAYHGSLGIDRADMPQLSGNDVHGTYRPSAEVRPKFVRYLEDRGIKVTSERVPAETLKPTQATGDIKAIRGIAADLRSGRLKDTKTIFVSADGRVLDGHHNWAGRMLADAEGGRKDLEPGMPVIRVDLPAGELLGAALAFGKREGIARRKTGEHQHPAFRAPAPAGPPQPHDTLEKYTRPDGTWDPARERLHQDIVNRVLGDHPRQAEPVAMFFGGGPASGKSSLTGPDDSARIDPDEIKGMLPEYQDMLAAQDPGAAAYTHEESSYIAKEAVAQARSRGIHYTLDGTGDSQYQKLAGKVNEARAAGYRVHARYVTADTDEAIRRATERAKRTGRMVPAPVIREIHAAVSDAFARAVREGLFDSAELYDTNGASPRLIAHGTGREFTVDDPAAWQRFLDKGTGSTG